MGRKDERHTGRGEEPRQTRGSRTEGSLEDRSVDELRELAGEFNIEDRYRMDRDQLIQAIEREQGVDFE